MRTFFIILALITTAVLWLATFLSVHVWIFELIADGALYLIALLVVFIFILAVYCAWRVVIAFGGVLLLYVFFFIFPITLSSTEVKNIPPNPDLFFMNTLFWNDDMQPMSDAIVALQPKAVGLVEVNANLLNKVKKEYGEPLVYHDDEGLSCAIFSKQKVAKSFIVHKEYPICIAEFADYALIVVHPAPPYTKQLWKVQQAYFANVQSLAADYQAKNMPVIIAGDMNSTWFSKTLRNPLGKFKVRSFLSWWANSSVALPIDHIVPVGKKIQKTYMLPHMSSDHRGLVAFF